MRVLLAIPSGGTPADPFIASLAGLTMPALVTAFDRITIVGNFVPGQRELAARRALAMNADVLLMFDDDMVIPPDAIERFVEAFIADDRLAVVGALYYSRDGLHPMVADRWQSDDTTRATIPAFGTGLTMCDVVGFGCVAIRVSAIASMPPPYFHTQVYVEEGAARVRICNEDYLFCEDARHAGWRVAVHASVRCKHYDRLSAVAQPREWEAPSVTAGERMIVVDAGPTYRMIPYDPTISTAREQHSSANLDYIFVD